MYKKFTAPQIFDGYRFLPQGSVLIVKENGMVEALVPASEAGDDVKEMDGILCPGFINCHCHLELSHLAGLIPRHTGLPAFLKAVMTAGIADTDFSQEALHKADAAMQEEGVVAVGDICNQLTSLPPEITQLTNLTNLNLYVVRTFGTDRAIH